MNEYSKMKTISLVGLLWVCLISLGMLSAHAEPPSVNVTSLLPTALLLDEETIAAVQKCSGTDSDFKQRFNALVADDQSLQQEATNIEKYKVAIEKSQQNLNQEETRLNTLARSQTNVAADLDVLRKSLHKNHATKPLTSAELQQENIKIQAYNNMSGEFNIMTDQYNNWVVAQKKRIADHNALVSKLNDSVAGYNVHAQALQGPLNKVLADVGYYQHKCAAGVIK